MGERKGTNKYYPPDYDPKKGGLNKFMGTHALRERARKLHLGILIIRFEMPFNIWCEGCENHIGMGVRYNAEKTKIGMYYSTPVYQFRMKCHLCDNHFEIKTDPGNLEYVIVSGARRQENRWDPTENGQVVPDDKSVGRKIASDPMFKLEHGVFDEKKLKDVKPVIEDLEILQGRWRDDYLSNKIMRDKFRVKKKELKSEEDRDKAFLQKSSLNIPLLKECEEDSRVASLIRLQPSKTFEERQAEKRSEIEKKSIFPLSESMGTRCEQSEKSLEKVHRQRASLGISVGTSKKAKVIATENTTNESCTSDTVASGSTTTAVQQLCPPELSLWQQDSELEPKAAAATVASKSNGLKSNFSLVSGDYGSSSPSSDDSS